MKPFGIPERNPLMAHLLSSLSALRRNKSGATMIEYCIIIACIAIVVVVFYSQIGQFPTKPLETVASAIG